MSTKAHQWLNSLSGFQGGNPEAELWICGIEYQQLDENFQSAVLYDVDNPPCIDVVGEEHLSEKFNKNMIVLAEEYYGRKFSQHEKSRIFSRESKLFKLNLYPLPLARTYDTYSKQIQDLFEVKSKDELNRILEQGRFKTFRDLMNKKNLKALVCCSRSHLETYVKAFETPEHYEATLNQLRSNNQQINGKSKYISDVRLSNGVHLFVVPFLSGRPLYTLTSTDNADIKFVAEFIRKRLIEAKAKTG